jgi:sister chromatid cohesion protein DCC1
MTSFHSHSSKREGELRPIAPSYLSSLLELILNLLVSLSLPYNSASVGELSSTLADEHEVARAVSTQVMSWFGIIQEGKWNMDINSVLKEMGLSILRQHKVKNYSSFSLSCHHDHIG